MAFMYSNRSPNSNSFGRMQSIPYVQEPIAPSVGQQIAQRPQQSQGNRVGDAVLNYDPTYQAPNYASPYQTGTTQANPSLFGGYAAPAPVFSDSSAGVAPSGKTGAWQRPKNPNEPARKPPAQSKVQNASPFLGGGTMPTAARAFNAAQQQPTTYQQSQFAPIFPQQQIYAPPIPQTNTTPNWMTGALQKQATTGLNAPDKWMQSAIQGFAGNLMGGKGKQSTLADALGGGGKKASQWTNLDAAPATNYGPGIPQQKVFSNDQMQHGMNSIFGGADQASPQFLAQQYARPGLSLGAGQMGFGLNDYANQQALAEDAAQTQWMNQNQANQQYDLSRQQMGGQEAQTSYDLWRRLQNARVGNLQANNNMMLQAFLGS